MKKITQIISVISLLIAAVTVILNFRVLFGRGLFIGFAVFNTMTSGKLFGFIGNLIALVVTALAFAAMGWFGIKLTIFNKEDARKPAFISGICVTLLAVISLFFSFGHGFNIGDILVILFPAVYTYFVVQSTKV